MKPFMSFIHARISLMKPFMSFIHARIIADEAIHHVHPRAHHR
jgi:hypothetical protein